MDWEKLEPSKAWDRKTFPQFFGSIFEETLDNLARSRLARSCVHVVLAMEASVFDVFHDAVAGTGILWCSPRKGCTRGTLMSIRGTITDIDVYKLELPLPVTVTTRIMNYF